ncbi:MAG: hypothetical protein OHK0039_31490 [Bacteroidia bacterium]
MEAFLQSLQGVEPPAGLSPALLALWHDGRGDWAQAHALVQDEPDRASAWVHAYLHRKEGDTWNADYWYRHAGRQRPQLSLEAEWQALVAALLVAP